MKYNLTFMVFMFQEISAIIDTQTGGNLDFYISKYIKYYKNYQDLEDRTKEF